MNATVFRAERWNALYFEKGNDFLTLILPPSLLYQKGSSSIEHFWERIYESQ